MATAAFYCASDEKNMVGVVALLNSLRLNGHDEAVVVIDAGLSDASRALLAPHVEIVPPRAGSSPFFQKYAFRPADAEVHVLIDADVIVTRPLNDVIELAAGGAIVAFADDLVDRFVPEWRLAGLGPLERRPYINTGFLAVPSAALEVLDLVLEREPDLDFSQSLYGGGPADAPFLYWDQDVVNALLSANVWPTVKTLEHRLAPHPPFHALVVVDQTQLRCRYPDGTTPYILHHVLEKPWLAHTRRTVYSSFLRRLVLGDDVVVRVPTDRLPLRLRRGGAAAVARATSTVAAELVRGRIGVHLRAARLHRLVRRRRVGGSRRDSDGSAFAGC